MRAVDTSHAKHLGDRLVYPEVGYCIYCYRRGVPLTDEHTIPDGLGGRHLLPKASCKDCQRIINTFEQYSMRTLLGNARASLGIKSSRKRPRPPTSVLVRRRNGLSIERVTKPINELPIMVPLPVWPLPFALRGIPAPDTFNGLQWLYGPGDMTAALKDFDAESFITENIEPHRFARMLAKIAHSHAIATIGPDTFRHALPPLILNEGMRYIEWVGGSIELDPPEPQATMLISFEVAPRHTDGTPLGVFSIRLFPNLGGPTYHIVIGEMLKPWP